MKKYLFIKTLFFMSSFLTGQAFSQKYVYDVLQKDYSVKQIQEDLQKHKIEGEFLNQKGWLPKFCMGDEKSCDIRGSVTAAVFDDFRKKHVVPEHTSLIADQWICTDETEASLRGIAKGMPCSDNNTVALALICLEDHKTGVKSCKRGWFGSAYRSHIKPEYMKINRNYSLFQKRSCSYVGMVDDFVHVTQKMVGEECYTSYYHRLSGLQVVDHHGKLLYFPNHIVQYQATGNPFVIKQIDNKIKMSCQVKAYDKKLFFPTIYFPYNQSYLLDINYIKQMGIASCAKERQIDLLNP